MSKSLVCKLYFFVKRIWSHSNGFGLTIDKECEEVIIEGLTGSGNAGHS